MYTNLPSRKPGGFFVARLTTEHSSMTSEFNEPKYIEESTHE